MGKTSGNAKLSDYFGIWKMTDAEYEKLTKELRDMWNSWTGVAAEEW